MNNLTPEMQARLDKWRQNPNAKSPGNPSQKDYGVNIRDYERKEYEKHLAFLENNPNFKGYK